MRTLLLRSGNPGIVVSLLLVFLASATAIARAQGGGIVEGSVVGKDDGRAVAGAFVAVEGQSLSATTNGGGRFRLGGITASQVVLIVSAPGFLELHVPNVAVGAGAPPLRIELDLTPNFLERVQVTATKEPLSIGDVAAQTDTVSRTAMDNRNDQTLPQAIQHVPGAVVSTQLGIFDSVMLRGMPRGDPEFTNTLLLVDGVPQTLSNNGARVAALPINDASSIEIVRGPNSALYGRTAIGGSINMLTADTAPQHEIGADFTGGNQGTAKGLGHVSGPIKDWGGYYVSLGAERNGGYFVTQTQPDYRDGNTALFGKLSFAPANRKSTGFVSFNRVISKNATPTNEPIVNDRLLHEIDNRFERFTSFNLPGDNYQQTENRLTVNYSRDLSSWAKAVEIFGFRNVEHSFVEDGDFIGSPYGLDEGTVTQYPFSQTMNEDILYQEFRVEMTKAGRRAQHFTVGASYEHDSGSLESDFIFTDEDLFGWTISYVNPVFPARNLWQHDTGSRTYHLGVTGIFGQYMIEPTSRLLVTAGGRYDRLDMDNTRDGGAKTETAFDAFSPKASATLRLFGEQTTEPAVSLYAAYSHAFLPPRRPSSLVPADVPLDLKPENIDNIEGGLKGSLLEHRLSLEAVYFYMIEDGVVLSVRQGPFFLPTNAGQLNYQGFETGASYAVSSKGSVYANAAFYQNRFGDFVIQSEDGDQDLTGNRLPISPDYVLNFGAEILPAPAFTVRLDLKTVGGVQTNRENTFELDPYTLFDASVTWRRGPLRITASSHNLFNSEYYWNGDGDTADPGRPRQFLVTTSVRLK
jgi:iron complex outermembrane receptor protein